MRSAHCQPKGLVSALAILMVSQSGPHHNRRAAKASHRTSLTQTDRGEPFLSPGWAARTRGRGATARERGGGRTPQARGLCARGVAHLEDLLHNPAVVLLEGHLIGLGGVDADEVGVVLVPLAVADALEEDLDEAQASAAGKERVRQGPARSCRPRPPTAQKPGCILTRMYPE